MTSKKRCMSKCFAGVLTVALLFAAGCGTADHQAAFTEGYRPPAGTRIEVGLVTNETGQAFDKDVEVMLAHALRDELSKKNLLHIGGGGTKLALVTRIVEFKKGSTWRRWMYPGWGEAILAIRCDLKDGERVVGSVQARRSLKYASPGAQVWRDVFEILAEDVAKELGKQMPPSDF